MHPPVIGGYMNTAEQKVKYVVSSENFAKIPSTPIAYWVSETMRDIFHNHMKLGQIGASTKGIIRGDNNRFLRIWHEVNAQTIKFDAKSYRDAETSDSKWYPCRKGGSARKWFGKMPPVRKR